MTAVKTSAPVPSTYEALEVSETHAIYTVTPPAPGAPTIMYSIPTEASVQATTAAVPEPEFQGRPGSTYEGFGERPVSMVLDAPRAADEVYEQSDI